MNLPIPFLCCAREDYEEWCGISTDLPPDASYDQWLENIKQFRERVASQGGRAIQIDVKPAELLAWCKEMSRDDNASARAAYAATRFAQLDKE
jgi:hypothetical protein